MTFIMIPFISIKFKPPNKWKNVIWLKNKTNKKTNNKWDAMWTTTNNKSQYQMWTKILTLKWSTASLPKEKTKRQTRKLNKNHLY